MSLSETRKLNDVYISLGIHPWDIHNTDIDKNLKFIREQLGHKNVIAIGESGLDKNATAGLSIQREVFKKQIALAEDFKKPLIIHCVKNYSALISIKKEMHAKMPWIIHGFNGTHQDAEQLIKHNCYLSFGYLIFKDNTKASQSIQKIDIEYIFFETDEANISIDEVYNRAADLINIAPEILTLQVIKNFEKVFNHEFKS